MKFQNFNSSSSALAVLPAAILLMSSLGTSAFAQIQPQSQLPQQPGQTTLNGAGATFPFPLIDTWRVEYQKVDPKVNVNYQSIGSGGGVKQFTEKTVDFGASDAPLSANETRALPGAAVHIPETIGSVVAAYNLMGASEKGLNLTGSILADIYLGKITKWDDPKIKELNPSVTLPSNDIVVIHRSDGSGTTYIWTSYLSLISSEWNQTIGASKSVQWPAGVGAPGNEGVANAIKSTPNSIGYVELSYALTTAMNYAYVQNKAGNFVEPTLNTTKAAVEAAVANNSTSNATGTMATSNSSMPTSNSNTTLQNSTINLPAGDQSWSNVTLLNAPGEDSYPIASFSYILVYKDLSTNINDVEKAKALVKFINWAITDGQQFSPDLSYVPLPQSVVQHNQETIKSLTFNGQALTQ